MKRGSDHTKFARPCIVTSTRRAPEPLEPSFSRFHEYLVQYVAIGMPSGMQS